MPRSVAVVLAALCAAFGLSVLVLVIDRAVSGDPAERVQARLDLRRGGEAPHLRSGGSGRESGGSGSAAAGSDEADPSETASAFARDSGRRVGGPLGLQGPGSGGGGGGTSRAPTPPGVVPPERQAGTGGAGIVGTGSGTSAAPGDAPSGERGGDTHDGARSMEDAVPEDVAHLEESAAALAERLALVDPLVLEQRVERMVPEGSVPPGMLEQARDAARRRVLADAAIAQGVAGAYPDRQDRAQARGLYETFSLNVEPETRKEHLRKVPGQLPH